MSGTNLVPSDGKPRRRVVPRRPDHDDDMPQDLLEFNSPSAALVALPPSPMARYIIWVVASMAVVMMIVMGTFPLDRVVSTPGELVSTAPTLLVQPFATSIVKSIDVKEGDIVHKGQVLAHLDPTMNAADLNNLVHQTQSYAAAIDRLKAEAAGTDYKPDLSNPASNAQAALFLRRQSEFRAHMQDFSQQIAALKSTVTVDQANAAMYAGRAKLAGDVHAMRMQLQRDQVGSRLDSLSAQDQLMEVERSQITAQETAVGDQNKLASTQAQEETFVQNWRGQIYQDLADNEHKYFEAKGDYDKAIELDTLNVMRAQADAVVLNIAKVSVGSVLNPASEFITLVPLDAPLEVEAKLTGRESGYVKLGDPALIKFATFTYTQYGGAEATVRNISADSFSQQNGQQSDPSQPAPASSGGASGGSGGADQDTFYRIRLRVDRYTLHGVPNFFHPVPGMPVTADIKVGKRTILRYLLSTVLPVATEGMREP